MTAGRCFSGIEPAPLDPILGIKQIYKADARKGKVDLSIGIYQNNDGATPALEVVDEAAARIPPRVFCGGYLPIEGLPEYLEEVQKLLFGDQAAVLKEGRVVTAQSLGGTSALRYGADFLKRFYPDSAVYVSNPSWENHRAIFQRAGFKVVSYPYYDPATKGLAFDSMCGALRDMPPKSIILLHTNCHNPTGVDLSLEQWDQVIDLLREKELIPFLDFAYQGFAEGIEEDAAPLRRMVAAGLCLLVANSFSKNFSLYRRRVGALSIVTGGAGEAANVMTQLRTDIRTNNSSGPVDGPALVAAVLSDAALRIKWEHEVAGMRNRIAEMRQKFVAALSERGVGDRFRQILEQRGMFSYSGLTKEEVERLKQDHAVYTVASGRICLAAMTEHNLEYVADSIAAVVKR